MLVLFFCFNENFNGEKNVLGACYSGLISTAELHFHTSFQGYQAACHPVGVHSFQVRRQALRACSFQRENQ